MFDFNDDFGFVPDLDGDGDHDLIDYALFEELIAEDEEEEELLRSPRSYPYGPEPGTDEGLR